MEIATCHLFLTASASQAASIFFTSSNVKDGLLRMVAPFEGPWDHLTADGVRR
jgi:hypothetical protein